MSAIEFLPPSRLSPAIIAERVETKVAKLAQELAAVVFELFRSVIESNGEKRFAVHEHGVIVAEGRFAALSQGELRGESQKGKQKHEYYEAPHTKCLLERVLIA